MIPRVLRLFLALIVAITVYLLWRLDPESSNYGSEVSAVFAATLALLTATYVVVAALQWSAMQRSLDLSARAWVLPSISETLTFVPTIGGSLVEIRLTNSGRTPAFAELAVASSLIEGEIPEVEGRYESGIVIPPSSPETPILPHIIRVDDPSVADLPDVENGNRRLYVWVFVQYRDGVASGRFTRLGWEYHPDHGRFVPYHNSLQRMD